MMIKKNNLLMIAGAVGLFVLALMIIDTDRLCLTSDTICMRHWHDTLINFIPIFPLFIFALITFWMSEGIYKSWVRLAVWWIPLSMILILISPEYSLDWMYPVEKGTVAFATSAIFVIISLILIIYKHFSLSRSKT